MTLRVFKCPFCGYRFRTDPEKQWQVGKTEITRRAEVSEPLSEGRKRAVDLTCPNCKQEYEEQVEVWGE